MFAAERGTANRERDCAETLVVDLPADLEAQTAVANTATNDLAAASATIVALRAALEQKTTTATAATTALATAQQEVARATSSENEAAAGYRAAKRERDSALAATADLQEALSVKTAATIAATTELAAVQEEASRARCSEIEAARAAKIEREYAFSTAAELRDKLAVQTASTSAANTELAVAQQDAARATSWANKAIAERRTAERERDSALSTVADLRKELAVQTASAATATAALADAQQEAARATSWANEAAAGRRAAELERDGAFFTLADLREELAVQTASSTTATTTLVVAQQEAVRATSWANEAATGRRAAERERDCAVAATANLQEALAAQTAATMTATTELAAVRQNASWAVAFANATAQKLDLCQEERKHAACSMADMRNMLGQTTAAANDTANQLANAANQLAIAQQERAALLARIAILEQNRAMEERESIVPTADEMQVVLEDLEVVVDGREKKRGPLALQESNVAAVGTAATVVPNPPPSHPFGPTTASGKPEESVAAVRATPLLLFYRDGGQSRSGAGGEGPALAEMLQQSDAWLEHTHDYIQWLFPTTKSSRIVTNAPVLSDADIVEVGRMGEKPQRNMVSALGRMLTFYGLMMVQRGDEVLVVKGGNFDPNASWMEPSDHNALRLTRIITSLRLFKLDSHADALQAFYVAYLSSLAIHRGRIGGARDQ